MAGIVSSTISEQGGSMNQKFTESFVHHLEGMASDRGKLATLRKGLIENQAQAAWLLINQFMNFDRPYQTKALQTVGGLFGHHPKNTDTGNFGSLCHQMIDADEKQKMAQGESGPISRHFQYALAANGEEIFPRVRRLVLRAKRDEIPINYTQLLDDLLGWESTYRKERIKLSWGKAFWKMMTEPEPENTEGEVIEND